MLFDSLKRGDIFEYGGIIYIKINDNDPLAFCVNSGNVVEFYFNILNNGKKIYSFMEFVKKIQEAGIIE